jgi:hypothetical protein
MVSGPRSAFDKALPVLLKLWTLLSGFRGKPPADVDAPARAAVRFGNQFLARAEVLEFEVNPGDRAAQGRWSRGWSTRWPLCKPAGLHHRPNPCGGESGCSFKEHVCARKGHVKRAPLARSGKAPTNASRRW